MYRTPPCLVHPIADRDRPTSECRIHCILDVGLGCGPRGVGRDWVCTGRRDVMNGLARNMDGNGCRESTWVSGIIGSEHHIVVTCGLPRVGGIGPVTQDG